MIIHHPKYIFLMKMSVVTVASSLKNVVALALHQYFMLFMMTQNIVPVKEIFSQTLVRFLWLWQQSEILVLRWINLYLFKSLYILVIKIIVSGKSFGIRSNTKISQATTQAQLVGVTRVVTQGQIQDQNPHLLLTQFGYSW